MEKTRKGRFVKVYCWLLTISFVVVLSLLIYYTQQSCENEPIQQQNDDQYLKLNLQKPVNHYVSGLNNSSGQFNYVIFTDPQLGLYDVVKGNNGTNWQYDVDNIRKFSGAVNALVNKPDFLFCMGDLNNAYPESEPRDKTLGFLSPYRPPQTNDLMQTLQKYFSNSIPLFMIAGNHDLTENVKFRHVDAHEKTWGQGYFYFWNAGRVFIALETQFFRSEEAETVELRNKMVTWLKKLFNSLPKDAPKTVFQHVALFIKEANETDSERAGKALPKTHRDFLLRLFCDNNVKFVFSGHTHFNSFPKPYRCNNNNHEVRQVVLTALTAQLKWKSDSKFYPIGAPSYMIVKVNGVGKTDVELVKLDDK